MLGKFKEKGWVLPLSAHAGVHAWVTLAIAFGFTGNWALSLALAWADFILHFIMDRVKASPHMLGRFKPDNQLFWWALGFDQMFHHLTHYVLIYLMITL